MERRSDHQLDFEPVAALDWGEDGAHHRASADIAKECSRCVRLGLCVAVITCRLGDEGDSVDSVRLRPKMRTLQRRVSDCLRHTDTILRLNEHEIVAVLPGADLEGGLAAARRLAMISISQAKKGRGLVFDLGVSALASEDMTPQELIDRARADYGRTVATQAVQA